MHFQRGIVGLLATGLVVGYLVSTAAAIADAAEHRETSHRGRLDSFNSSTLTILVRHHNTATNTSEMLAETFQVNRGTQVEIAGKPELPAILSSGQEVTVVSYDGVAETIKIHEPVVDVVGTAVVADERLERLERHEMHEELEKHEKEEKLDKKLSKSETSESAKPSTRPLKTESRPTPRVVTPAPKIVTPAPASRTPVALPR
jgi:hypothetical protein